MARLDRGGGWFGTGAYPGATPGGGTEKVGGGTMEGWGTAGGGCPGGGILRLMAICPHRSPSIGRSGSTKPPTGKLILAKGEEADGGGKFGAVSLAPVMGRPPGGSSGGGGIRLGCCCRGGGGRLLGEGRGRGDVGRF